MFPFSNQNAFGLDLSDLSLKIIKLRKVRKKCILENYGEFSIPRGPIEEGKINDPEKLGALIKKCLLNTKPHPLKTKDVICSLPEEEAFLRIISLPLMTRKEIPQAVRSEVESNIPLEIEEVYWDWQLIKPLKNHLYSENKDASRKFNHLDILIAAVPKKIIDVYVETLEKAGLNILALEVESIATIRSLVKGSRTLKPLLIIDLGAKRTSFIIFSGSSPRLTTNIDISGEELTRAVSKKLNVANEEAEKIKCEFGLDKTKKRGQIFSILAPIIEDLIAQIQKQLDYYEVNDFHKHDFSKTISEILLCGGGANLSGLTQYLSSRLRKEVRKGNPWINISLPSPKNPPLTLPRTLSYTTALGLALRGITDEIV